MALIKTQPKKTTFNKFYYIGIVSVVFFIFIFYLNKKNYIYPSKTNSIFELTSTKKQYKEIIKKGKRIKKEIEPLKEYCEYILKIKDCCIECYFENSKISLDTTYKIKEIDELFIK